MEVGRAFLGSGCHEGSQNEHLQTKAEETGFCPLASGDQKPEIQGWQGGPLDEGHLGCFQVLAITNKAARNICLQGFVWI